MRGVPEWRHHAHFLPPNSTIAAVSPTSSSKDGEYRSLPSASLKEDAYDRSTGAGPTARKAA